MIPLSTLLLCLGIHGFEYIPVGSCVYLRTSNIRIDFRPPSPKNVGYQGAHTQIDIFVCERTVRPRNGVPMKASANKVLCSVLLFNCGFSLAQLPVQRPSEVEILKAHNDASKLIIEKAYSVLFNSQVFASRTVGEPGGATSLCWALTVIVRYDPQAKQRLTDSLALTDQPEQKLYFLAGLLALDPATAKLYPISAFSKKLRSTAAHTLCGCSYDNGKTFERCLSLLYAGGTREYLFDDLPSIYQTIDVSRQEKPEK